MKKLFYLLLLIAGFANGQIVNIPDANFKAKLIALGIDSNADGEIQVVEAQFVTGTLNIANSNISDLTGLEFFTNLTGLFCVSNLFVEVDVSHIQGNEFDFSNNPNLQHINLKNGFNNDCIIFPFPGYDYTCAMFLGLPNLQYICVDEGENINWSIQAGVELNSYCSFNPGGNYNTITGTLTYDANSNGCDTNDAFFPNIKMKMQQWGLDSYTFSNNSGNYKFYTTFADQSVEPIFENPTYFNPSPASAVISFPDTNLTAIQDFCITPNGIHPDLEIVLAPVTPARPGFDAVYNLVIKNKGNQTLSGNVYLYYDDAVLDFVSATVVPAQTLGLLTWAYADLWPFEARSFFVTLNVNSPTETPAVNISDQLIFNAATNPVDGNEITFSLAQTVVGSFDPNDIACLEGEIVSPSEIGNYLHYMVNFENTGNYAAENVVVKIEIDANKFDVASLQLLDSSTPLDARVTGNKVEFIFKNIQLAGPGGHGNILLKIKTKNNLITGDMVSKNANIYFDYNAPVTTLPFDTTFQILGLNNPNVDDSIAVFPNPTSNFVTVKSKNTIKSLQLFDVQGRLLQTNFSNQKETKMDISEKANGVYFIKITSEGGVKIERIVKQ